MSLFFMWSIAHQRYFADRVKVLEFLIELTQECVDQKNFSSFMQLMSALEHGSIQKFKQAWEFVSKNVRLQKDCSHVTRAVVTFKFSFSPLPSPLSHFNF